MAVREVDNATTPGAPGNVRLHVDEVNIGGDTADAGVQKQGFGEQGSFTYISPSNPLPVQSTNADARNTSGSASAVAPGNTATVVSYVADAAFRCFGFTATGNTDGYFELKYGSTTIYAGRTHAGAHNYNLLLPSPDGGAASQTVTIVVTNRGPVTGNYVAALFGE